MGNHDREGDAQSLYDKLAVEVSVASWSALESHAKRGALFWVDRQLDLAEVAVSIALDDVPSVKVWRQAQLLLPAASTPPENFAAFHFLIVQPYVLATPLELPTQSEEIH